MRPSLPPRAWHLLKPDLGRGHRLQLRADAGDKARRCRSPSAERGQVGEAATDPVGPHQGPASHFHPPWGLSPKVGTGHPSSSLRGFSL